MITCRPIRPDEADTYLSLLCEVFDLDQSRAGQVFYSEPFYDLARKWALFDSGHMTSILSMTPLTFGWGDAVGIAGVATLPSARGKGFGQRLLESALAGSEERSALLFAYRPTLYARVGFEVIDEVISGEISSFPHFDEVEPVEVAEVKQMYTRWSE
ncbi:MAG: GNAT family N-acetyltransferase, partial [Armatimonadota bacterium]